MKNGHLHSGHGGLIVKLSKWRLSQKGVGEVGRGGGGGDGIGIGVIHYG